MKYFRLFSKNAYNIMGDKNNNHFKLLNPAGVNLQGKNQPVHFKLLNEKPFIGTKDK